MKNTKLQVEELLEAITKITVILEEIDKMFYDAKGWGYYDCIGMRREAVRCALNMLKLAVQA